MASVSVVNCPVAVGVPAAGARVVAGRVAVGAAGALVVAAGLAGAGAGAVAAGLAGADAGALAGAGCAVVAPARQLAT